jgi:hypothetical protein
MRLDSLVGTIDFLELTYDFLELTYIWYSLSLKSASTDVWTSRFQAGLDELLRGLIRIG